MSKPNYEFIFVGNLIYRHFTHAEMRAYATDEGLRSEHFQDPDCRAIFDTLMSSRDCDEEKARSKIMKVFNCFDKKKQEVLDDSASVNAELARDSLKLLAEGAHERAFKDGAGKLWAELNEGNLDPEAYMTKLRTLREQNTSRNEDNDPDDGITPNALGPQIPEEEDPNALFSNGFLEKGGGLFLVAPTEHGKSTLTFQMCYYWARGLPAFGIKPLKPLKIAVFQTEDSKNDMRKFRDEIARGLIELEDWTREQFDEADKNIRLYKSYGKMGDEFIARLHRVINNPNNAKPFDLVLLNPLQAFFGGDINKNSELSEFLRRKIDPLIDGKTAKCGIFIVHHTNKPQINQKLERLDAYMGAGGAEAANWMRAGLALTVKKGRTFLVATKRGGKLGWAKSNDVGGLPAIELHRMPQETKRIFWMTNETKSVFDKAAAGSTANANIERLAAKLREADKMKSGDAKKLAREMLGRSVGESTFFALKEALASPEENHYGLRLEPDDQDKRITYIVAEAAGRISDPTTD